MDDKALELAGEIVGELGLRKMCREFGFDGIPNERKSSIQYVAALIRPHIQTIDVEGAAEEIDDWLSKYVSNKPVPSINITAIIRKHIEPKKE